MSNCVSFEQNSIASAERLLFALLLFYITAIRRTATTQEDDSSYDFVRLILLLAFSKIHCFSFFCLRGSHHVLVGNAVSNIVRWFFGMNDSCILRLASRGMIP